jgi:LDH2 family malate/lactate/ureidoglycolate dehydrogenase
MSAASEEYDGTILPYEELRHFVRLCAERCGLPPADQELFTDALLQADLRGIPSHGVYRLGMYARGFLAGEINPKPAVRVVAGRGAFQLMDGDNGLGLVVGQLAMDHAVDLAREHGIGAVSVRESNHSGVLAVHALRAARRGMLGFFTSNAPALMAPWGSRDALLSNSPFAWAFPAEADPVVVDMACSAVARGRIRLAASDGRPIPLGWALDSAGQPTSDARAAMDGIILPMGEHKGYSLAVANEILATCLSGARLSMDVSRAFLRPGADTLDSWHVGHLAMAVDIAAVRPLADFEHDVARLEDALVHATPSDGAERVMMPGQPELESVLRLSEQGIPVSAETRRSLERIADELQLELPVAIPEL